MKICLMTGYPYIKFPSENKNCPVFGYFTFEERIRVLINYVRRTVTSGINKHSLTCKYTTKTF
jgi:hypothetical protein